MSGNEGEGTEDFGALLRESDEEWLEEEEEWLEAEEGDEHLGLILDEDQEREILDWYDANLADSDEGDDDRARARSRSPLPQPRASSPIVTPVGSRSPRSRSRSRSCSALPQSTASQPVIICGIFDEAGNDLLSQSELATRMSSPVPKPSAPQPPPQLEVVVEVEHDEEISDVDNSEAIESSAARGRGWGGRGRRGPLTRGGRGAARGRGRGGCGRGRGQDQWRRGDRLTEVCRTDDEVQGDLKETVMRVNARKAAQEMRHGRTRAVDIENEDDDGGDAALFDGDESALRFDWSPMDSFRGEREQFRPPRTGSTKPCRNAYEAFRQYWDDGIMSVIATETNRYAATLVRESHTFARFWYDTNVHELLILFGFWMMLGIIRMPTTKSCFTTNPLLKTDIFRKMFSRNRYEQLCRALNFVNDAGRTPESSRLFPIENIVQHLNFVFKSAYIPKQEICIDESLKLWKGKLSFSEYIKTKAAHIGVKTFELCETASGYLWSFIVYTGKDTTPDPRFPQSLLKSSATVLKLVWPLLDQGYTLFMDSCYNSPILARFLKRHGTDCVGTLRQTRRNVPPLVAHCALQDGQFLH